MERPIGRGARTFGPVALKYAVIALFVTFAAFPFAWMLITTFKQTPDLLNPDNNPFWYNLPPTLSHLRVLAAAGLPNEEFLFVGFLPARSGERRRMLERLRIEERTMIFYEAPHRVAESIADAQEILGDRPACLAREVTKLHEEFLRGKLSQLAESLAERPARGEITLIVGPPEPSAITGQADSTQSLSDRVEELIRQAKLDRKEALKLAAKERGITRRAAYEQLVESKAKPN